MSKLSIFVLSCTVLLQLLVQRYVKLLAFCICNICIFIKAPSVLWCCWLGLLTCKTHYRVGEPTAAWKFIDICQHRSFDNVWQYVSCGQWQPPLSDAPVIRTAVNYHEGEIDPSGFRVWWNSSCLRDIFVSPYRQCLTGSSWQQQQVHAAALYCALTMMIWMSFR